MKRTHHDAEAPQSDERIFWRLIVAPAVLFLAVLGTILVHDPPMIREPLSNFRDGPWWLAGYLLFGCLITMGVGQICLFRVVRRGEDIFIIGVSMLLLLIVVLTPSLGCFHGFAALALMIVLYCFYGTRLFAAESPWVIVHGLVPVALIVGCCIHSEYGVWQKVLIAYYVICIVIDAELSVTKNQGEL